MKKVNWVPVAKNCGVAIVVAGFASAAVAGILPPWATRTAALVGIVAAVGLAVAFAFYRMFRGMD